MNRINYRRRDLLSTFALSAVLPAYGATNDRHVEIIAHKETSTKEPVKLFNIHTKERLVVELDKVRLNDVDTQKKLNYFFRDHRQNSECSMDTLLIEQLQKLQIIAGNHHEFQVIAGFRTKETNDLLRRKSVGVARFSYHLKGKAVDVRLPGTNTHRLWNAAIAMHSGGVGYYPRSNFIHLDTGKIRNWVQL